jgi:hypothetical protein
MANTRQFQSMAKAKKWGDSMVVSKHDTFYNNQSQNSVSNGLLQLHEMSRIENLHLEGKQSAHW